MCVPVLGSLGGKEAVAQSANPMLRQFSKKQVGSLDPTDECEGKWMVASPETTSGFSGVAYFFGRALQSGLKKPVGLVHTAWPGTSAQGWTSSQSLDQIPAVKAEKDKIVDDEKTLPTRFSTYKTNFAAWESRFHREDRLYDAALFANPGIATEGWKPVTLAGSLSAFGLPDAGVIWLRHQVTIPKAQANRSLLLALGDMHFAEVYWNGTKVDEMTPQTFRRAVGWEPVGNFTVPAKLVKEGEATLAIRLRSPAGGAAVNLQKVKQPLLDGSWLAKAEYELPALDEEGKTAFPGMTPLKTRDESGIPTFMFNGMLRPLIPYAMRGVVWYQGESNAHQAFLYRSLFPLLIRDWRANWGTGDFAFYWCQLPNSGLKTDVAGESKYKWAELREAQQLTLALPKTGQAVLIDIGGVDLHPSNKKDVGERLSKVVLAQTYGQKIPFSGPVFASMTVEGTKIRLRFQHAEGGLKAKPLPADYEVGAQTQPLTRNSPKSELEGFAICGEDRKWVWADARIDGETVLVESPLVTKPIAVRYAWADNPTCNLYNGSDLPAGTFRTDDFPLLSGGPK